MLIEWQWTMMNESSMYNRTLKDEEKVGERERENEKYRMFDWPRFFSRSLLFYRWRKCRGTCIHTYTDWNRSVTRQSLSIKEHQWKRKDKEINFSWKGREKREHLGFHKAYRYTYLLAKVQGFIFVSCLTKEKKMKSSFWILCSFYWERNTSMIIFDWSKARKRGVDHHHQMMNSIVIKTSISMFCIDQRWIERDKKSDESEKKYEYKCTYESSIV